MITDLALVTLTYKNHCRKKIPPANQQQTWVTSKKWTTVRDALCSIGHFEICNWPVDKGDYLRPPIQSCGCGRHRCLEQEIGPVFQFVHFLFQNSGILCWWTESVRVEVTSMRLQVNSGELPDSPKTFHDSIWNSLTVLSNSKSSGDRRHWLVTQELGGNQNSKGRILGSQHTICDLASRFFLSGFFVKCRKNVH